jgi:hypothetical protein
MFTGLSYRLWINRHKDLKKQTQTDFFASGTIVAYGGSKWLLTARHNLMEEIEQEKDGEKQKIFAIPEKPFSVTIVGTHGDGKVKFNSPVIDLERPRTFWSAKLNQENFDIICVELFPDEVPPDAVDIAMGRFTVNHATVNTLMDIHTTKKFIYRKDHEIEVNDHLLVCSHPSDGCVSEPSMLWGFSAVNMPKRYGSIFLLPGIVGGMSGGPVYRVIDKNTLDLIGVVATKAVWNIDGIRAVHMGSATLVDVLFKHAVTAKILI